MTTNKGNHFNNMGFALDESKSMKASKSMKTIITQLSEKFELDLKASKVRLRLDQDGLMPLVIEKISTHLLSVAHYYYVNGHAVCDPKVVFLITSDDQWLALEITQLVGGFCGYAELADDGKSVKRFNAAGQKDLCNYTKLWARNIADQGWLQHGVRTGNDQHLDEIEIGLTPTPMLYT